MASTVTVDFFRVRIEEQAVTFQKLLTRIIALTALERNLKTSDGVLRLHALQAVQQSQEGDMTRIRLTDLPARGSLEGELSAIDLDDDEGLAEQAAFLYRPATDILLLQRNRNSVTARSFARYVAE